METGSEYVVYLLIINNIYSYNILENNIVHCITYMGMWSYTIRCIRYLLEKSDKMYVNKNCQTIIWKIKHEILNWFYL